MISNLLTVFLLSIIQAGKLLITLLNYKTEYHERRF